MDNFDPFELEVLRSKSNDNKKLPLCDSTLICECNCVALGEIRSFINKDTDFEYLAKEFKLGTGCKGCIRTIKNIDLDRL